jgi:transposase-like protein
MSTDAKKHRHRRLSSEEKTRAVIRALRGESRQALAEELKVPLGRLEAWESTFLDAGRKALSSRKGRWPHHGKVGARIAQWSALLLVLLAAVYFLTRFMQSTGE